MKIDPLTKAKKKKIIEAVENIGITTIPEALIKTGSERIRAFSGNITKEEIYDIWRALPIEAIGLTIAKEIISKKNGTREVRLSVDALHHYKDQINNNIITLTSEQEEEWFLGKNIELSTEQQRQYPYRHEFVVIQSADKLDFIGTGKVDGQSQIIYNYLPKERRRKQATIQ